ncbi:ParB family protein [Providencia rettgeri]|uniref:ParB family protein n=1 Tax=Providencia rettgeri TaxID=587 RepID=UPI001183A6CB|nr:ParB family protein [Providencia rettgeri]
MTDVERGTSKDMYLGAGKRTGFEQKSGLPPLRGAGAPKRTFTLKDGRKVDAEHVVVPGSKVSEQTVVHALNPRNQEALDENSMRDILEQIRERGVDTEGIAVRVDGVYQLIEGSRRRYCCAKLSADLPLWVLPNDISNEDIFSIISAAQSSRKFSYREVGMQYLKLMEENGFTTNEELAQHIGISTESVRKRIQAAQIDPRLIALFPDCEGIPNTFYSRLAKVQGSAKKEMIDIGELCQEVQDNRKDKPVENIQETQKDILEEVATMLEIMADKAKPAAAWKTSDIVAFENKDQYARISYSGNGRKVRFEFNRLNQKVVEDIERLIRLKLSKSLQEDSE